MAKQTLSHQEINDCFCVANSMRLLAKIFYLDAAFESEFYSAKETKFTPSFFYVVVNIQNFFFWNIDRQYKFTLLRKEVRQPWVFSSACQLFVDEQFLKIYFFEHFWIRKNRSFESSSYFLVLVYYRRCPYPQKHHFFPPRPH